MTKTVLVVVVKCRNVFVVVAVTGREEILHDDEDDDDDDFQYHRGVFELQIDIEHHHDDMDTKSKRTTDG
jgi:hypothetical protein